MIKVLLLSGLLALSAACPMNAKDKKDKDVKPVERATNGIKPYSAVITSEAKSMQGLFTVHKVGTDWYFEIPDSILSRVILAVTRYTTTPVEGGLYGGEMANNQTVYWEKATDNKLLLRALVLDAAAEAGSEISKAVAVSTEDPIIGIFPIEAVNGSNSVIKVTDFFSGDIQAVSLPANTKKKYHLGALAADKSYIEKIKSYPINTEVHMVKTFASTPPADGKTAPREVVYPAAKMTGAVTMQLNTSFVLLPEKPMRRRLFDLRVGYFTDKYTYFADDQQAVKEKKFICRWRLEPKPEDVEKMKRGELVEPQKPIIFYIDPATPKQWRKYLIEGVNDWQKAFEEAGFKNAIFGKEWPENDTTMSMEDARFSVIRYLASPIPNAYGPQVHDPRSGEIIESHIGWYHNVMKLVHDWYMIQAGCSDKRANKMQFDDELMGDLIRFVSSHEVGHTLGLRHNMGASSLTPVEKLRDKAWVEANGHTASIMDYARFNYVAQPEDNVGPAGLYPRINIYDKWAIKWGYMPVFDVKDDEEERLVLNELTVKTLANNPRLWFGSEEIRIDPRSQREDLGDNSMKASEYGIKNLKRIVKTLPDWTYEEGDLNTNLHRMHQELIGQFRRYLGHVAANVGGIYRNYKSVEEAGNVYQPVPKATQKEALAFFDAQLFTKPAWIIGEPYMFRIYQSPEAELTKLIDYVFDPSASALIDPATLVRMADFSGSFPDSYLPDEYMTDLCALVFKELNLRKPVDAYRRHLQNAFVDGLVKGMNNSGYSRTEVPALMRDNLDKLVSQLGKAIPQTTDAATLRHYRNLKAKIEQALNPVRR
ncbi:zinc-dependent metalloprotease [Parabacteroides bouchesdurhonensis]|uniref:zinc-dependent metalloprotease n=1 Tax=Parabacteroides bouchesdurhonensis TaxID=1936995 RepID=UPI0018FE38BC|nr:zinc-dependent metalloprotease [Parabacteroides bouchesdurhonensis]